MKYLFMSAALAACVCLAGCAAAHLTAEEHESLIREARAASVLAYREAAAAEEQARFEAAMYELTHEFPNASSETGKGE